MKYYKNKKNEVFAFEDEVKDSEIAKDNNGELVSITEKEMKKLTKPKPLSAEEQKEIAFNEWKEKKLRAEFEAELKEAENLK